MAFKRHCGIELQKEMDLNYNQGTRETNKYPSLKDIELTLENIEPYLMWYAKNNNTPMKLVLPLLGCGVGKLNILDVYHIYKDFFQEVSHLIVM